MGVHANAQLLGIFADVDGDSERSRHILGLGRRVVDPSIPPAGGIDENELCIVQSDPNDHGRRSFTGGRHEFVGIANSARVDASFCYVFEGPRSGQRPHLH
jgi:hypothetical protein